MVLADAIPEGVPLEEYSDKYFNVLQNALNRYCRIYDAAFQDLPDTLELDGRAYEGSVEFVLAYPSFNIRRNRSRAISV